MRKETLTFKAETKIAQKIDDLALSKRVSRSNILRNIVVDAVEDMDREVSLSERVDTLSHIIKSYHKTLGEFHHRLKVVEKHVEVV